jgi:hypothetical protein
MCIDVINARQLARAQARALTGLISRPPTDARAIDGTEPGLSWCLLPTSVTNLWQLDGDQRPEEA